MTPDADDPWLLALGAAVADGKTIDWDAAERNAPDAERRALVERMRRVAELAAAHGAQPTGKWRHLLLYEKIGEGAFGAVYRGSDPQLDRDVAVKLLSRSGGEGAPIDEARHLARVRHGNIVTVYGADRDGGQSGLWMEYVKGQTLDAIVRATGPMSAREAIGVALDLTQALSALHGAGLLHRDVKATNVMREVGGRIVLMDFSGAHARARRVDPAGRFSGTPLFMAPELFDGGAATPASDVYSLGVLLFFLLTGALPVTGRDVADLRAAHAAGTRQRLRDLRPDLSDAVVQVVERMTAADPARRYQTAGELESALLGASGVGTRPAPAPAAQWWWPVVVSAVLVALVGVLLWHSTSDTGPLVRFTVGPPYMSNGWPRLSQQGTLAFGTVVDARDRFWVRPLDAADPGHALEGTTARETPFWSPDGKTLAFFEDGTLKRISIDGGDAQKITDAPGPHGGDWYENWILFATDAGIFRIAPDGTQLTQLTAPDKNQGDRQHGWPEFLPDGNRFLYLVRSSRAERSGLYLGSIDGRAATRLMDAYSRTAYSAGHILYVRDGVLQAQPFDPVRGVITGQPAPIASHIKFHPKTDAAFDATPAGVLAYATEPGLSTTRLALFDRRGRELRAIAPPAQTYRQPRFSPDGTRLVAEKGASSAVSTDLWLFDLTRGGESRLTAAPADEHFVNPAWSPDGKRIAFSKRVDGRFVIVVKEIESAAPEERLAALDGDTLLEDWSHDNKYLSAEVRRSGLWIIPLDRRRKPWLAHADPRIEIWQSEFSPDSRYIAYTSEESGRPEVFVEPLPATGARWQISMHGGGEPHWRADGRELFYLTPDGMIESLAVNGGDWQHGAPTPLFRAVVSEIGGKLDYSVAPDGQTIVVNVFVADPAVPPIDVVVNWPALLKR